MGRRLTVTLDLVLQDDTDQEQLDELLGAVMAQLEDDEAGALESFQLRAHGVQGWDTEMPARPAPEQ